MCIFAIEMHPTRTVFRLKIRNTSECIDKGSIF
jgi:hypothetical protein